MTEPIWNQFLTARDKAVFATSGYGARQGFGKRPALLVIDVNYAFCGDKPEPILESIKKWRNSCGEDAWVALPFIRALIDKAREKGLPVIYTTGVRRGDLWDSGSWAWKNNRSAEDAANKTVISNLDGNEIMAEITPGPRDIVIYKQKPSGFFGTNLASYLTACSTCRGASRRRNRTRCAKPQGIEETVARMEGPLCGPRNPGAKDPDGKSFPRITRRKTALHAGYGNEISRPPSKIRLVGGRD